MSECLAQRANSWSLYDVLGANIEILKQILANVGVLIGLWVGRCYLRSHERFDSSDQTASLDNMAFLGQTHERPSTPDESDDEEDDAPPPKGTFSLKIPGLRLTSWLLKSRPLGTPPSLWRRIRNSVFGDTDNARELRG